MTIVICVFVLVAVTACKASVQAEPEPPRGENGAVYRPPEAAPEKARDEGPSIPPEAAVNGAAFATNGESVEIPIPEKLEKKEKAVESTIKSVTVYMDRAAVTRRAKVSLERGAYDLIFEKLPRNMDWNSVRARGTGKVRVVNMKVKREHILKPADPQIAKLEKQLEKKRTEMAEHNDDLKTLAKKESLLDSIRMRTGEKSSAQMEGKLDVGNLVEVMGFLDKEYKAAAKGRRELNRKIQDVQREINLIQRKINDLRSKMSVENIKAIVTVVVTEKTDEEIALEYVVQGASWHAEYDLRASASEETAELSYFCVVNQQTGEDWKDVQLMLSTAEPDIAVIPPTLRVWNVGLRRPVLKYSEEGKKQGKQMFKGAPSQAQRGFRYGIEFDEAGGEEPRVEEYKAIQARVLERGGVAVTFAVPRRETIISGPEPHRTIIALRTLKPKNTFITIPRHRKKVYLQAEITNNTPYTLLPGRMSIFLGTDYVGTTNISHVAPTQKFKVNFGTDSNILVKRERVSKYEEDKGWGGKKHRITYEYKITLQNFKSSEVVVRVFDQIPVSTHKDIVVKLVESNFPTITEEPKAGQNKKKGILEWRAQLPPDPKRKNEITYKYYIEYPKEMSIYGAE